MSLVEKLKEAIENLSQHKFPMDEEEVVATLFEISSLENSFGAFLVEYDKQIHKERKKLEFLFRREDRLWKESKRQNKSRFLKFLEELLGVEGKK